MAKIVTVTLNPAVDKNTAVRQVVAERKLRCTKPQYDPGGGGLNVARAIKTLGGEAIALWTCGGPLGELLQERLDHEGLPHVAIPIEHMTRENLIVYEEASGEQFRFGMPGAELSQEEADRCLRRLHELDPEPAYLVLSGSLPPGLADDFYAEIARQSSARTRIVLDTSGPPLGAGIEGRVYLIKPNIAELGHLAGSDIDDDAIVEVSRMLISAGKVEVVVTSLGSAGVMLVTAEQQQRIAAPTVKIRSKVGAGDSTVAGIVLGLAQGRSVPDAVKLGVAAGSAAVMTEGTQLCRYEDTWRLYEQITTATPS
jgi:6-phosphofructokinase 2